jgi:protein SCO1/2
VKVSTIATKSTTGPKATKVSGGSTLRSFVCFASFVSFVVFVPFVSPLGAQFSAPLSVPPTKAASEQIPILKDVGIDQKLGAHVPLDLPFVDEEGRDVVLGDFFGTKPVVLVLAYYQCPMLCSLVLNGAVGALQTISLDAGQDFEFVVVSFNPGDTPAMAAAKKHEYLPRYGRDRGPSGFHFLTGRESSIKALTSAVGFKYAYDPAIGQFAHPSLVTVLTPAGSISRYIYGIDFPPYDLRLALVEAGSGQIGTPVDRALLFCYHYDPETGRYGFAILNVVRLGGVLTVAAIGAFVVLSRRRDRRREMMPRTSDTGAR